MHAAWPGGRWRAHLACIVSCRCKGNQGGVCFWEGGAVDWRALAHAAEPRQQQPAPQQCHHPTGHRGTASCSASWRRPSQPAAGGHANCRLETAATRVIFTFMTWPGKSRQSEGAQSGARCAHGSWRRAACGSKAARAQASRSQWRQRRQWRAPAVDFKWPCAEDGGFSVAQRAHWGPTSSGLRGGQVKVEPCSSV